MIYRSSVGAARRLALASGVRHRSLLAAIDQGTSSSRVILYDESLRPIASHQQELQSATANPHPGWSEMDPMALLASVEASAAGALEKASATAADIAGVGITCQRESTVVWDRRTGDPLHPLILWHDARTAQTSADLCAALGGQDALRATCGLPISTYFSAVKMRWLLENVAPVKAAIEAGTALVGTVDAWLAWNLTGGAKAGDAARHVTDLTNASRTMLMDLHSATWSDDAMEALGVRSVKPALPQVISCAEPIGVVANGGPLDGAPLTGCIGDQQAAMVGQRCFDVGQAKITYGTGAFLLVNAGGAPVPSAHGLLSTALYQFGRDAPRVYALEGAVASCAVGINWFRDALGMIGSAPEISALAAEVPGGTDGVYFVSAFGGLLAPHWRDDARATLVGLTLAHDRRHIARAVLEGVAFQAKGVCDAMRADTGVGLASLRVDGGVSLSNELLQYQADLLGQRVERPADVETTAVGAAICAGLGAGVWRTVDEIGAGAAAGIDRVFEPAIGDAERDERCEGWARAVECSLGWAIDAKK